MSGKNTLLKIIFVFSIVGAIALAAMLPGAAKAFVNSDEAGFFARLVGRPELAQTAATSSETMALDVTPEVTQEPPAATEEPTAEPTEEPTAEPTEEPTAEPSGESTDMGEFELVGTLFAMDAGQWDVSGITVVISATTEMTGTFEVGMLVKVEGKLQEDGSVLATEIKPALNGADPENNGNPDPGNPHDSGESELVGTLTAMDGTSWMLNGLVVVTLDDNTEVGDGVAVGQMVKVEGALQPDGSILAREIKRFAFQSMNGKTAFGESELYGTLDEMTSDTSWKVSGFTVILDDQTQQDGTFDVGVNVKVEGLLQADGSILAREIKVVGGSDDGEQQSEQHSNEKENRSKSEFKGVVTAISADGTSFIVNGITVLVTSDTEIKGDLKVGVTVMVEGTVQADSSVTAEEIKAFSQNSQSNKSDHSQNSHDNEHDGGQSGGGDHSGEHDGGDD